MKKKSKLFKVSSLRLVKRCGVPAKCFIGNRVRLNSGGPVGLVVDHDKDWVWVSWQGEEHRLPKACVTDA